MLGTFLKGATATLSYQYLGDVVDLQATSGVHSFSLASLPQVSNCVLVVCFAAESDRGIVTFADGSSTYSWDQAAYISFSTVAADITNTSTAAIYSAEISSMPGTINVTTTADGNRSIIAVYAIRNYGNAVKRDAATAGTDINQSTISATLNTDVQVGDVVIAIAEQGGVGTSTWTASLIEYLDTNTTESGTTFTSAANYAASTSVTGSVTFSSATRPSSLAIASWR
jgi:hypothetical protein